MTRLAILAAALALAACADEPKVVTRTEYALPAPPSADLLVAPAPVVTAGSANMNEVVTRMALGLVRRDQIILGWQKWWLAAKLSAGPNAVAK